jgi:hypothetical protein
MNGFVQFFTKILQVGFTRITRRRIIRTDNDGLKKRKKKKKKKKKKEEEEKSKPDVCTGCLTV